MYSSPVYLETHRPPFMVLNVKLGTQLETPAANIEAQRIALRAGNNTQATNNPMRRLSTRFGLAREILRAGMTFSGLVPPHLLLAEDRPPCGR